MGSSALDVSELVKADDALARIPRARKIALLIVICIAEFLDTFSNSALFSAIPPICQMLNISNSNSVWLQSGYQLTFASLLLMSGRISDLYNPKWVFVVGGASLGLFSLGAGFVRSELPLLVLRALMGVGAALTVPSALHMIVHMFPNPGSQSKAVGLFSTMAALGNVFGLIIGALFVSFASWPWVFYFIAILGISESILVVLLCHSIKRPRASTLDRLKRFQRLDVIGVGSVTVSLILFIFAVTSGSIAGWGSGQVVASLVLSVFLIVFFTFYEGRLSEDVAAIPPKTWKYTNIGVTTATALLPFMWWGVVQSLFSWYWQEVYGWSAIITAVHFLPLGLIGVPATVIATMMQQRMSLKWVMVVGNSLAIIGSLLLPFAKQRQHYWTLVLPGFIIGSGGIAMTYVTANAAIFAATPPEAAGVVAAIFNSALQLGCAAGIAIATSIQASVEAGDGGPSGYKGTAAAFWFLLAATAALSLALPPNPNPNPNPKP
ncbi:MFS general substrate transporter [Rhodocollybia butyracea]|uniref:MFS general substrate transporter n=1 Tax=Rhodocollybia butyracea TaxID=206335 RepID=A0A9P5P081_9AGAR|nr:MFS general substrate transporter [Rhodocollybia butyracea]